MKIEPKQNQPTPPTEELIDFRLGPEEAIIFLSKRKDLDNWKKKRQGGRFFLAKDNFWTSDFPTTASSLFLYNFTAPQDAAVIQALRGKGYTLLGKSVLDEFACGGTGLFAAQGALSNPLSTRHLVGGSSSGSAAAVALGIVPFALGHDSGDSLRRPASYCGIFAFKPSYGLVSRYGVIPMAASLDTVGLLARDLSTIEEVFSIISFPDNRDLVSISAWKQKNASTSSTLVAKTIAIIKNIENYLTPEYAKLYLQAIEDFRSLGYQVNRIDFSSQLYEHLQITYLVICSSELVSHLNSLQGVTFGGCQDSRRRPVMAQRSKLLGRWVRERVILGSYFLSKQKIITKARQMRNLFKQWLEQTFLENDFLVFPGTVSTAPQIESVGAASGILKKSVWVDNLLLLANFSGSPSLNIPLGREGGLPLSLNIDGRWGCDESLLKVARNFLAVRAGKLPTD